MTGPVHLILYVADQAAAADFWARVLQTPPSLDVPGMTEFGLGGQTVLGLMPEAGIARLLGPALPDPVLGRAGPRAEVYLVVDDVAGHHARALAAGAAELSPPAPRDWGDQAAYCLAPDGYVVAFASRPGTADPA
jgi:catechol 2,3-dioxygenase-like lactoylglutathione lyase family enzyme